LQLNYYSFVQVLSNFSIALIDIAHKQQSDQSRSIIMLIMAKGIFLLGVL